MGGELLAEGYVNQPALTARSFLPDPFTDRPGARMYKSGDLARRLADGQLEFLGRSDEQVKIRGVRIEPGEIEAVLIRHAAVEEALVVARTDAKETRLVAYCATGAAREPDATSTKAGGRLGQQPDGVREGLRRHARRLLPEPMVPSDIVLLSALPRLPSGKLDRAALPEPAASVPGRTAQPFRPGTDLERAIAAVWRAVLNRDDIGLHDNFFDVGGHSLLMLELHAGLVADLQRDFSVTELFRFPTIRSLSQHLCHPAAAAGAAARSTTSGEENRAPRPPPEPRGTQTVTVKSEAIPVVGGIAIVGMSCRFPGAKSLEAFWDNLCGGVESLSSFSIEQLEASGVEPELFQDPRYVAVRGVVEDAEMFDAAFFDFSAREAEITDPQHRVFLECCWEALEHAGHDPARCDGLVGVFAGAGTNHYAQRLLSNPSLREILDDTQIGIATEVDFLANRVSYKLDLRGPSMAVQAACATSLVVIHHACQSLLSYECDMALGGAVSIRFPQESGYLYREGGILSPDGHCRAFNEGSRGTVSSNGAGVVVLKRLADAFADGDTIYAVIRGSATNNDGRVKAGYTAPSELAQARVLAAALADAGVDAKSISYVEAHGSGTLLGDPIEIAALKRVFRGDDAAAGACAIGSVKTNLGHLNTAAGMAGLIKTALALRYRHRPPSLHFERPNPETGLEDSPFFVNTAHTPWPVHDSPRRAGVSSFGFGGSNAHLVLEEAPRRAMSSPSRRWQMLFLSGRTETALEQVTERYARHLQSRPSDPLPDITFTSQVGRRPFEHRRVALCREPLDAAEALVKRAPDRVFSGRPLGEEPAIAFVFPGLGDHYVGMSRGLYEDEPSFKSHVDACAGVLRSLLACDLRDVLYADDAPEPPTHGSAPRLDVRKMLLTCEASDTEAAKRLNGTVISHAAQFVVEYSLGRLLMEWGFRPQAMLGHSLGEYVAACWLVFFISRTPCASSSIERASSRRCRRDRCWRFPCRKRRCGPTSGTE